MPIKKLCFTFLLLASPSIAQAASRWILYTTSASVDCSGYPGGGRLTTSGADAYCADEFTTASATSAISATAPLTYTTGVVGVDKSSVTLQGNTFNAANKLMQLSSVGSLTVPNAITASTGIITSTIAVGNNGSNNGSIGAMIFPTDSGWVRYGGIQGFRGADAATISLDIYTMAGDSEGISKRFRFGSDGSLTQYKTGVVNTITAGTVFSGFETHQASQTFTTSPITLTPYSPGVMHIVATSSNVTTGLVSLSTETTGNYVASIATNSSTTGGQAGSAGAAITIGVNPSSGTLQGNTFNGASQLVQMNGSTQLPAVSGVNLTNLNGSNVASGTVGSARLPADTVYNDVNTTFTSSNTFTGISTFTANVNISADIYTGGAGLTDYSGTSTIVGWSSFTTKTIQYKKVGKSIRVFFDLRGTSNSTSTTFTVPFNSNSALGTVPGIAGALDNGTGVSTPSQASLGTGSNSVTVYKTFAGDGWTASGTKIIYGILDYESQ